LNNKIITPYHYYAGLPKVIKESKKFIIIVEPPSKKPRIKN
jgi:hypothetical protein